MWGSYDPVESSPSEPKKCSVKKCRFLGPEAGRAMQSTQKELSFWCLAMIVSKNLDDVSKKIILGQKTAFSAKTSAFFTSVGLGARVISRKTPIYFIRYDNKESSFRC